MPGLAPLHCRRRAHSTSELLRTLSRVAASKPTSWLSARPTSFPTEPALRDLSRWSGLLPSRRRSLAPAVSLAARARGIRGLVGVGSLAGPSPNSALPPRAPTPRGCTSMHFGENQLSPGSLGISPLPTAHPAFCNSTGSGLHAVLPRASPWPWVAHPVSGLPGATQTPCSDSLSLRLRASTRLNLAAPE